MAYGWKPGDWDRVLPGIWARYVISRSQWTVDRLDRLFFPSRAQTRSEDSAKTDDVTTHVPIRGSSAFRRYLACKSTIDFNRYSAAGNPFLQIDSCWPGTFRFLSAPFVSLFYPPRSLRHVQRVMLLTDIKLRGLCFAGAANAMRRTYADPQSETTAIAQAWSAMDTPRLRAHYFPDFLGMALGWVQEAIVLGELGRLKLVQGPEVLPQLFGISFSQLDFLEPDFARFLDVLLQLTAIQNMDLDPYQFAVEAEAVIWLNVSKRCPELSNQLDFAALRAAVFLGKPMDAKMLAEDLLGTAIPDRLDRGPVAQERVSWDRSDLLTSVPPKNRKSRTIGRHSIL